VTACDFAAVKGTLIVRMPLSFAGWRWSDGLGRLVCAWNGSLPFRVSAPVTGGVPWTPRRGTIVGVRHQSHAAIRAAALTAHSVGDTSFTRSRGPCSSIVTTSPVKAVEGGALDGGSRLGKPGNRRNQHRHLVAVDEARLDAHSDSRKRDQGMRQKRMGVAASLPSRITRVPVGVPARRKCSCRSRPRRHLVSNKLTCSTLWEGTRRE